MAPTTSPQVQTSLSPRIAYLILLAVIALAVAVWWRLGQHQAVDPTLASRASELAPADLRRLNAIRLAIDSSRTGDAARLLSDFEVPKTVAAAEKFRFAEILREAGYLSSAENYLAAAVAQAPHEGEYRLRLADLLFMTGRHQKAQQHWVQLLQTGGIDLLSLPLLGNTNLYHGVHVSELERHAEEGSSDPLVDLGRAAIAVRKKEFVEAESLLQEVIAASPDLLEAQILLGRLLFVMGREQETETWLRSQGDALADNPEYWVLGGRLSRSRGQYQSALRCFAEVFRRDPTHFLAVNQIGQLLQSAGKPVDADWFLEQAQRTREYASICLSIHAAELPSDDHLQRAVRLSESIGCLRDAVAWCLIAQIVSPDSMWPDRDLPRLRSLVTPRSGRHEMSLLEGRVADLLKLPLPDWSQSSSSNSNQSAIASANQISSGHIWFEDVAKRVGIDFVFEDGSDPDSDETRLFEFTGGGVAVIDFDLDGHPDIFFTQGGPQPEFGRDASVVGRSPERRPTGRLYRNLGNGKFVDVTTIADTTNRVYAQGCTVGDFNSDGFPDLYIANIGTNRLLENNGDGTFSEVRSQTFAEYSAWTTSCVLADLNADGLPDIYDVNHVIAGGVHARMCKKNGASVPCNPNHGLQAEQDRLLLNLGDGRFQDVTQRCSLMADEGLGLGVVVADFDGSGRLSLFVANDGRANFFFRNNRIENGLPRFVELAVPIGLAFNADGKAQACMGVAVDDLDADGLLDMFVTNFYDDYNTLYRQQPGLLFDDATARAGLVRVSHNFLGFGTQSLDADSDGLRDLVLTNGDVVDFSKTEPARLYRQRPQFLRNTGRGRFTAISAAELGPFFQQRRLGRGLARLDWNRDGREDFVVSHIGHPAALVTNVARHANHFLDVRLVGTTSNRDAIGTEVVLVTSSGRQTRQLVAGDGYFASNQRHLIFGLGTATEVTSLTVRWPTGHRQSFQSVAADQAIIIVEETHSFHPIDFNEPPNTARKIK
jgi:tetratricopeptide (TPR) repeat protein